MKNYENFCVVDTETTWSNKLMSVGFVISDNESFKMIDKKYFIIVPEYQEMGMFSNKLFIKNIDFELVSRSELKEKVVDFFNKYDVKKIFAYNARFDYNVLKEFQDYDWYDIMNIAANRKYNHKIPFDAETTKSGKLKRNYGVEPIYRLLSDNYNYCEVHNGLCDAIDELEIMYMLEQDLSVYEDSKIN